MKSINEFLRNNSDSGEIMYLIYDIERCIVNLVSNAHKFTPNGGRISVTIKDLNNSVEITVEDTGIGIEKKYHDTIFDRYSQVVDKNNENRI